MLYFCVDHSFYLVYQWDKFIKNDLLQVEVILNSGKSEL